MKAVAAAGLSFAGRTMRYAEVERERHGNTLRRLGSCRFDFEAADCLATGGDNFETLVDATTEIFADSRAELLAVALDPRLCYQFVTAISNEADDELLRNQILKELALVADDETPLYVRTESLELRRGADGGAFSLVQVFAVPETTRARIGRLAEPLGVPLVMETSLRSAASLVGFLEGGYRGREDGFSLLLGHQNDYAEFGVCVHGHCRFAGMAVPEHPADALHAVWSFLRRFDLAPADIESVYVFGDVTDSPLSAVARHAGAALRKLGPLDVVHVKATETASNLDVYVPCVGAALLPTT